MSIEETKRKRAAAQHLAEQRRTAAGRRPLAAPQVSLLPRELLQAGHIRALRRRLVAGVVLTAVVTAAAVAGSAAVSMDAASKLALENQRTTDLAQQIQKYQSIQQLQNRLALDKAAVRVGSSTAIDWDPEFDKIWGAMPKGFSLIGVATDSATPIADYTQGETPLDQPRAASITVTTRTRSLAQLPAWLARVTALPEVADASPTVNTADSGTYTVVLTVHFTTKAYRTPLTTGTGQ